MPLHTNSTGLQPGEMRMGPCNIYLKEGGTSKHVGYVAESKWQAIKKSKPIYGGQDGETPVNFFGTGLEFKVMFKLQQYSLLNLQRALLGNSQGFIDDTTATTRRLEIISNAGYDYRAGATELKLIPIDNGIETTDLERILVCPIAAPVGNTVEVVYTATNQQEIPCEFFCFTDPAKRGRAAYFGDDAAVDATTPTGLI